MKNVTALKQKWSQLKIRHAIYYELTVRNMQTALVLLGVWVVVESPDIVRYFIELFSH